jgi:hypothetical protein
MVDTTVNEYLDVSSNDLRDRATTLYARLDKGWEKQGDAAYEKWHRLLDEYEAVNDELRRRGLRPV